jgi:hypothetical protein
MSVAGPGMAWLGRAWLGKARRWSGWSHQRFNSAGGHARLGRARLGRAGLGRAWQGKGKKVSTVTDIGTTTACRRRRKRPVEVVECGWCSGAGHEPVDPHDRRHGTTTCRRCGGVGEVQPCL